MNFYNTIGTIGAVIVSYSNLPQIALFFKQGDARGISVSSTWIGTVGLLLRTAFLMQETKMNHIVLGPYYFAIVCTAICLYFMYFPRKATNET